jgi:hypothetical protein|tara:strand:+ start:196 stop:441 length:246 start_codon:yes stop_codon:yes gene_type:complete
MSTVAVKDKYREETNEDVYATMENYGGYTDNYVKWLENQVMNNFALDTVIQSDYLCDRECSGENKCDEQCYMCADMENHSV